MKTKTSRRELEQLARQLAAENKRLRFELAVTRQAKVSKSKMKFKIRSAEGA